MCHLSPFPRQPPPVWTNLWPVVRATAPSVRTDHRAVKQGKSWGSTGTTITPADSAGVSGTSGETPIGAASYRQLNTTASCQKPPFRGLTRPPLPATARPVVQWLASYAHIPGAVDQVQLQCSLDMVFVGHGGGGAHGYPVLPRQEAGTQGGERPIGAAHKRHMHPMASCQPPPPRPVLRSMAQSNATLLFGPYFLRTKLFIGHGGGGGSSSDRCGRNPQRPCLC